MISQRSASSFISLSVAATLGLLPLAQLPTFAQSKPLNLAPQLIALDFQPPQVGQPPATAGGASRGEISSCFKAQTQHIVPLIPNKNLALTVEEYPTLFWSLPESLAETVNFTLLNPENEVIYEKSLNINGKTGIVSISIPKTIKEPLKVEKVYHWYVELVCNAQDSESNPHIEGWVKRIEPSQNLVNQLKKAVPKELPALYAQAGIWQETLTTLADLRRANPTDPKLSADWESLLKSAGLQDVSTQPLVN